MRRASLIRVLALVGAMLIPVAGQAAPITVDFSSGTAGDLGSSSFVDGVTGLGVNGYYSTNGGASWSAANLFRVNGASGGFGACNPSEATCSGGNDGTQVDNSGQDEVIRLALPAGYRWVSIQLASLDYNGGNPDQATVSFDDSGVLGSVGSIGGTFLANLSGDINSTATLSIPSAQRYAQYLYLEPKIAGLNSFFAYNAALQAVPEPGSVFLTLTGIGIIVARLRRRERHDGPTEPV